MCFVSPSFERAVRFISCCFFCSSSNWAQLSQSSFGTPAIDFTVGGGWAEGRS